MYIGKLGNAGSEIKITFGIEEYYGKTVKTLKSGLGSVNEVTIPWSEIMDTDVGYRVSLGKKCFVDTVEIDLDGYSPEKIVVYDKTRSFPLASYVAETGKTISEKTVRLLTACPEDEFVIVFSSSFANVKIADISVFGAVTDKEKILFPTPKKAAFSGKTIKAERITGVSGCPLSELARKVFAEKFREITGITLTESEAVIFEKDENIAENGYKITFGQKAIRVKASDERGFVIAAERLISLTDNDGVTVCNIDDHPAMNFRGAHIYLPPKDGLEFAKRMIKYVISPFGYNYVILEFAGGMRFESHPEIAKAVLEAKQKSREGLWPEYPHNEVGGDGILEKSEVKEFTDYIRSFGIEVIPEVQSLGHVQFMTIAHPEIAEREENAQNHKTDERYADVPPGKFYAHCYCPSNPKSYGILFDLLDEIIDLVKPKKYVHMGHDEVYQIGVCPVCKKKDPALLYASDVTKIHDHLAARGLKMMIWSDMLQPVSAYKTVGAVDLIPKDIIMTDFIWYFHFDRDIETNLTEKGFEVVLGNMYSSHFPRYESRVKRNGIIGAEVSTWTRFDEESLGREGKIYDFVYSSEMTWNPDYDSRLRYAYDLEIRRLIPVIRSLLRGNNNVSISPRIRETEIKGNTLPAKFDRLTFTHVCPEKLTRIPWIKLETLGHYSVKYADGTEEKIPVRYGGEVKYSGYRQNAPLPGAYYRHNGYSGTYFCDSVETRTRDGKITTEYLLSWDNPKPEVEIVSLGFVPETDKANLKVLKITGTTSK